MEKILFFSLVAFDQPTLQYSGSSDNDVITLVGQAAKEKYVEIEKQNLIHTFKIWEQVPDHQKVRLAKIAI